MGVEYERCGVSFKFYSLTQPMQNKQELGMILLTLTQFPLISTGYYN